MKRFGWALSITLFVTACIGSSAVIERVNPAVPGSRFKVIATIAAGDAGPDFRMSATVRQRLNEAGWTAVRRPGRWESERSAVVDICSAGDVDGVLIVAYNRLELDDCESQRPAYRIDGSPERDVGLTEMVKRLMQYLRGQPTGPLPN